MSGLAATGAGWADAGLGLAAIGVRLHFEELSGSVLVGFTAAMVTFGCMAAGAKRRRVFP